MVLLIADISVAAGWDWCCTAGESPDGGNRPLPEPTPQPQVSALLTPVLIFLTSRVSVRCCLMNFSQGVFTFRMHESALDWSSWIRIGIRNPDPDPVTLN
jgi:hypothetical protein